MFVWPSDNFGEFPEISRRQSEIFRKPPNHCYQYVTAYMYIYPRYSGSKMRAACIIYFGGSLSLFKIMKQQIKTFKQCPCRSLRTKEEQIIQNELRQRFQSGADSLLVDAYCPVHCTFVLFIYMYDTWTVLFGLKQGC